MANYFNSLPLREQLAQLAQCEFMGADEFNDGVAALKGKKIGNCRLWRSGPKSRLKLT